MKTFRFHKQFEDLIAQVRCCEMCPLEWYQSEGFEAPKWNQKARGDAWRWLHKLDPVSKQFHTTIKTPQQGVHCEHAYYP